MKKKCIVCKNDFYKKSNKSIRIWLNVVKYCSKKCHYKDMEGKLGYWKNKNRKQTTKEKIASTLKEKEIKPKVQFIGKANMNPNWKGGKGNERHRLMGQKEYILWRTTVFIRDDYTCQECKQKGVSLQADHIKPWALFPELRYAINNGRTLCVDCHRQTDTYGDLRNYGKGFVR